MSRHDLRELPERALPKVLAHLGEVLEQFENDAFRNHDVLDSLLKSARSYLARKPYLLRIDGTDLCRTVRPVEQFLASYLTFVHVETYSRDRLGTWDELEGVVTAIRPSTLQLPGRRFPSALGAARALRDATDNWDDD